MSIYNQKQVEQLRKRYPKEQGSAWTLWTRRGCRRDYKER